jgi:oxygen-dependent protoporphyrinogen oxidase
MTGGAPGPADPPPVAILGAGITGLAAAWRLTRAGVPVVVLEASGRVGGAIGSVREGGWLRELGPNSLIEGSAELAALIGEVGLGPRRVYAPRAGRRYVVRGGRPVPMPASPAAFVTSRLFSPGAKLRILGEFWRPAHRGPGDESLADFVTRRLGREFLDYAANPFVGGVYAGDPARLSVRHAMPRLHALEQRHGSLIRGAIRMRNTSAGPGGRIFSFQEGLAELPGAIAAALGGAIRLNSRVLGLRPVAGQWEVDVEGAGRGTGSRYSAVVSALPADALAALRVENMPDTGALRALGEIEQPPVASVFTGYRRGDVAHALDGFGVLVPEVEGLGILGTLFSSSLFPLRAPEGHVALTTFVGGTRRPGVAALGDAEVMDIVRRDLGRLLGVSGDPAFVRIQRWPRAIPQYNVGFDRFKQACASIERDAPGLLIGGNCRDGISLAACVESGCRLAAAAGELLSRR